MFQPPAPMLARLDSRLPVGERWCYEPKLDGFRGLLWRCATGQVQLLSRNARDLGPWFPELVHAADALPAGTVLDGEIVICDASGWVDFGSLQERLSTARTHVLDAAQQRPAVLVVFDVLELAGVPLHTLPLRERRRQLEELLNGRHPCLQPVSQTGEIQQAEDWLTLPNVEGVVATRRWAAAPLRRNSPAFSGSGPSSGATACGHRRRGSSHPFAMAARRHPAVATRCGSPGLGSTSVESRCRPLGPLSGGVRQMAHGSLP